MIEKLEEIKSRFEEVGQLIVRPDANGDMKKFSKLNKEYKDLEKVVRKYDEYTRTLSGIKQAKEILEKEKDEGMSDLAKSEIDELTPKRDALEDDLIEMLM